MKEYLQGKSVLVTGGAGFIGSHLTRALVSKGACVRVLDNFSTGSRANLAGVEHKIDILEGDIRNAIACRHACRNVEIVFHLAAYISVPGSVKDPIHADSINIGGTLHLLLAAKDAGVHRFIFSSSAAVYGDAKIIPTHEKVLPLPLSPYGVEKLYGEQTCRLFHRHFGLQTVSLRYFNVYGPGQNPTSEYAAVIPKFITALLSGKIPTIFGDGLQTRDFLYVEDVVRANLLAAQADGVGGEVFNIATGQAVSVRELYNALLRATGQTRPPQFGPERPGDIRHSCADVTKARKQLGFTPMHDLAAGLEETVRYYQQKEV
jgi:nucleoside-diphosphate-sugar epimerase